MPKMPPKKKTKKKVRIPEESVIKEPPKSGSLAKNEDLSLESQNKKKSTSEAKTSQRSSSGGIAHDRPLSKATVSFYSSEESGGTGIDEDVVTMIISETTQKLVHCLIGKDLFVDKTWCLVKKADILEDIAIEDLNSPFFHFTQRILSYKPDELLIGYEPFSTVPNQFMLCLTEAGRDDVLNHLEELKCTYINRIEQSKEVVAKKWESQGSEEFIDQFQIKKTRKLISLEWIGDITKRCFSEPKFEDCDPDAMKNGYTCLIPTEKEKMELVFKRTQEAGIQAVAQKTEVSVQTVPEIPTNASTQYAPETEISVPDTTASQAVKSQDLNAFFNKYLDYLSECLNYNEVYDLYHDDYPALTVPGEETQVQQLGTYYQYQSFTDVAAIEGKLVISASWHPNYTGIVAIAYANEIPCLMKELECDSDQTEYEEEKTDEEVEPGEEPDLGTGAKDWLEDERRERESTGENMELFEKAMKRLRDIDSAKTVWDAKIQEGEELRKPLEETESDRRSEVYEYREYKEPEPEPEIAEVAEGETGTEVSETQEGDEEEEAFGILGKDETVSQKTSKTSFREQLEADIEEQSAEVESPSHQLEADDKSRKSRSHRSDSIQESHRASSETRRVHSVSLTHKRSHHQRKHRRNVPRSSRASSHHDQESMGTLPSRSLASSSVSEMKGDVSRGSYHHDHGHELFDEVTDEEEIKEKQDELPLLEINNPVLIWSFVDDLTPKLRLDSPYEIREVEFSKHDGNLIAGGTISGQVVVWDITGRIEELERPEALTENQQVFRKRMENLMKWRRDIQSKRRVRISAITSQVESHLEKISSLMWVGPSLVVKDNADIIKNPSPEPNLQILTSSVYGDIKVWDLRSEPMKSDYKKQLQQFKTKERFGRPPLLDTGLSPFSKLNRRWKPTVSLMTLHKNMPVLLRDIYPQLLPVKYHRVTPKVPDVKEVLEDRIEYKLVVPPENSGIPLHLFIGNLFGEVGTLVWDPPEEKLPDGENIHHVCRFWNHYHDGPIVRVRRHPFLPSICVTIGGHVFAVWHNADDEEPIVMKRYYGVYITDVSWSTLKPSLLRIARSDGVVEIWDFIIQNHAPATTIIVSGRYITKVSSPLLPEVRGLLGVADYNSAFRLFYIPQQFRVWTESELERLTAFVNREPERKKKMREWSKWWRENNVNLDREEKKQAEEQKKLDEEVRLEKEKKEEARKKYNEEVYKWYMRRRGKPFLWREEAEEKWREKQEEHMHEVVMAKKKIDRTEMEILMRPIVREEKNEAQKHAKAQERLKQADAIFRQTVDLIFPKSSKKVEGPEKEKDIDEECNKLIEHYFGENYNELADEQDDLVKRSPWQLEFEWSELLDKYNALRMLFNDRRRKRSKTLRWLRKKLREELIKEGRKVHVRRSHMARYPKRKIKRRQENLDWLKQVYGDDYNVYWDKHRPCRRFSNRKFRYPVEDTETSSLLGELSEPDVEDEEVTSVHTEGKPQSSLEIMTEKGIEHVPEEMFSADLDTTLLTLESRSSLGVKTVPSLIPSPTEEPLKKQPLDVPTSEYLSAPSGYASPQDESDISIIVDEVEDKPSTLIDNQLEELDYIQQSIGSKIDTLQTKKAVTTQKREISEGVRIELEELSIEEDEVTVKDNVSESISDLKEQSLAEEIETATKGSTEVTGEVSEDQEATSDVE